jgi:nucleoside-diphosphate-sugar epimerase
MKILITGASGFIGTHVVRVGLQRSHQVLALSRSPSLANTESPRGMEVLVCDLSVDESLKLDGFGVDVVVHLAASLTGNADEQYRSGIRGTENLLRAMRLAGIRRLIGISSIAVLDYVAVRPMSTIDESFPHSLQDQERGIYASVKVGQEAMFKAFGTEPGNHCVILRPALVFDDTHLINAYAGILRGPVPVFVSHKGEVPLVSVEGVANAILDVVERDVANGEIIQLVDDNLPSHAEYLVGLRRRGLLPTGGITVPWRIMAGLVAIVFKLITKVGLRKKLPEALLPQSFAARMKPFRYSNAKAKQLLAWVPGKRFT